MRTIINSQGSVIDPVMYPEQVKVINELMDMKYYMDIHKYLHERKHMSLFIADMYIPAAFMRLSMEIDMLEDIDNSNYTMDLAAHIEKVNSRENLYLDVTFSGKMPPAVLLFANAKEIDMSDSNIEHIPYWLIHSKSLEEIIVNDSVEISTPVHNVLIQNDVKITRVEGHYYV